MNWPVAVNRKNLDHAASLLRAGGVVAFPTETYYGLAVDPFNPQALERLFFVKHRPRRLPILVLVAGTDQLPLLTGKVPAVYGRLIDLLFQDIQPSEFRVKYGNHRRSERMVRVF